MMKKGKKMKFSLLLVLLMGIVLIHTLPVHGQVRKTFIPRQSAKAPAPYTNVKNYNIQGDFAMIGNTNLQQKTYSNSNDNSNLSMVFVDIDDISATKNSSSAELQLPNSACTEILYAGLYWSGRAHDIDRSNVNSSPMTFNGFDKRKVKLKAGTNPYQEITALDSDIYYPSTTDDVMYAAYADVTDYVRQHGAANYFVADIALQAGNGGDGGYYGGWGMVIIYKNEALKWRDITVFDGYAFVASGVYNYTLPIEGFRATQYGEVRTTLGIMAGEGDRNISGDYFEIKRGNTYDRLKHSGNTTGNFFNSSIVVGGTPRTPQLLNNTGLDIARFDLDNTGNKYIQNNATSATFRYGSTKDTYIIYNMVFAVDAYVPDVYAENIPLLSNGSTLQHNGTIVPGQQMEFQLNLYNKGTEGVNTTKIEIPIPTTMHYVDATITSGLSATGTFSWQPPAGGSSNSVITPGGTLVWNVGNLPLTQNRDQLLAQLKYSLKASEDCVLLSTTTCSLDVNINGNVSGVGAISRETTTSKLIRGYGSETCAGPVYSDFKMTIVPSASFLQNCSSHINNGAMEFKEVCSTASNQVSRTTIEAIYPPGTKFFTVQPSSYTSATGLVQGDFDLNSDGSPKNYFAVIPGMEAGCYVRLTLSKDVINTVPTAENVSFCVNESVALNHSLSVTGIANDYTLFYFDAQGNPLTEVPNPTTVGIHRYFVAEGKGACYGNQIPFEVTLIDSPTVSTVLEDVSICENSDSQLISVVANGSDYTWEYSTTADTTWRTLTNTTFNQVIILTETTIKVEHATKAIHGIKIRLKVNKGNCENESNTFTIQVNSCPGFSNPMLLNQAVQ